MKIQNSNSIGERINRFDDSEVQTVYTFNSLFPECPLKFNLEAEVVIGHPAKGNRRAIKVGDLEVSHKMFADTLYNIDKDEFRAEDGDELDEIHGYPV